MSTEPKRQLTEQDLTDLCYTFQYHRFPGTTLTVCAITTHTGFVVTGESACLNPASYNEDRGQTLARKRALDKLWQLEGYKQLADHANNRAPLHAPGF